MQEQPPFSGGAPAKGEAQDALPRSEPQRFEDYPLSRLEYINVMVHFYRG
jgi:hypothetical protein